MDISRKFVVGLATVALAVGLVAVITGGSAFARAQPHKATLGKGSVSCSNATGSISFKPALTASGGASSDTVKVAVTLSGCTGGTPSPTGATVSATVTTDSNKCTSLQNPNPTQTETLKITWSPKTIAGSTTVFGPTTVVTSPFVGLSLSKGVTTGSYAGSGASATALSNESEAALLKVCSSAKGLSKLVITSGTATG
ncbi:MAG TPA: hypothetical protein VED63_03100 [Acidimicrobiales bacterium]|nr:hypothetical protein [Acidimicrobiales bacterium]